MLVWYRGKMRSSMIVHALGISIGIIIAMPDALGSIPRFIVLDEHVSFFVGVKQSQVGRSGRFVGMVESVFVPKGRGASAEKNCLANK